MAFGFLMQNGSQPAGTTLSRPAAAADDDPWSALQSQYTVDDSPRHQHGHTASGCKQNGQQLRPSGMAQPSEELVLVTNSDEEDEDGSSNRAALVAVHSASGGLSREASATRSAAGSSSHHGGMQQYAGATGVPATAKKGGWGAGQLVAPGTLMVGGVQTGTAQSQYQDDVFDDSHDDDSGFAAMHSGDNAHATASYNNQAYGGSSHGRTPGGVSGVQDFGVVVEDVDDDVDALIEAELAAKSALPADLAEKLAQFEAMADDDY